MGLVLGFYRAVGIGPEAVSMCCANLAVVYRIGDGLIASEPRPHA